MNTTTMGVRRTVAGLIIGAVTCVAFAEEAAKEQPELTEESSGGFSAELSVDVLSDYMWRGIICNDNPVWQPSLTLAYDTGDYGSFGVNFWASFDLTHKRNAAGGNSRMSGSLQEIDYTLMYDLSLGDFDFELGHIFYTFPNGGKKRAGMYDQDVYASVAYNNDIVTPSAAVYWNYGDAHDSDPSAVYFTFGLSHEFALTDALSLTPSATLGFGDSCCTGSEGGTELTDSTIGLSAGYALTENVSLGAQINYTWLPSHTLRREGWMSESKDQMLWGGVNLTLSF